MPRRRRTTGTISPTTYGGLAGQKPTRRAPPLTGTFGGASGGLAGQKPVPLGSPVEGAPRASATGGPQVDAQLEAQKASANLNIGLGGVWDAYQTGQVNTAFGNLDNPSADAATNPYSRAAMLQKAYQDQKRGTTNSYASQGQLYSGALQSQAETDLGGHNQGLYGLRQERQGALDEILKGGLDRYSQVGASVNQDTLAAILRALGAK